nr:RNA-directed DNA polymerase (reverse transcriptase) domain containing protein [Haemonchus contortus]
MYDGSSATIRTAHGQTGAIDVTVGVHQGSALTPFLFLLTMDVTEEFMDGSLKTILYADDIALIAESKEELQDKLQKWQKVLAENGLRLNVKETKFLSSEERTELIVDGRGGAIEKVQNFRYLESDLAADGSVDQAVKSRIKVARMKPVQLKMRAAPAMARACADAVVQVDDTSMIEHIHSLQHELIESHNRQADYEEIIRECKIRIADLEAANKRLREHELFGGITILQDLQEELISVKMREAESNLAVKEMRQRLDELEQYWAKYVHARMSDFSYSTFSSDSTAASSEPSSPIPLNLARSRFAKITAPFVGTSSDDGDDYIAIRKLEDQLMGVRIKEAVNMAELKEMRQKVMKLETQRLVCTNRIRQQIDEMKRVRKELEAVQKAGSICNEPNGDLFSVGSENMIALLAKIVVNIPVLDDIAEEQSSSENKEMYDGSDTSNCDVPNS